MRLGNYDRIPDEARDHHESEVEALAGGYSYRQVLELVQNAADAILEHAKSEQDETSGRIVIRLSGNHLYAANTGSPLSRDGIVALLSARSSSKRQNQIGRFGIGFKSLLGLGGRIDLFSHSISLRFDPLLCGATIRKRLNLLADQPAPGLRLCWPVEPEAEFHNDAVLRELSQWATTVIRIDIERERMATHVAEELDKFPAGFLLFLPIDVDLELHAAPRASRHISRRREGRNVKLIENRQDFAWQVVDTNVLLTDPEARVDATAVHTRDEVPLAWALPLTGREETAGRFWAFFPTNTASRIPGILNAPWKVNSDRTALIQGPYNSFLMENAANLVAEALAPLATADDPARPLDMFPRELDGREDIARPIVDAIWDRLSTVCVVADGNGVLQRAANLALHPIETEEVVRDWNALVAPDVRAAFVHSTCYRGQRLNRLKSLLRRSHRDESRGSEDQIRLDVWMARIADLDITTAKNVLLLAKRVFHCAKDDSSRTLLQQAKIIPSSQDSLVAASDAVIATDVVPAGKFAVNPALAADEQCLQVLQLLGVRQLDDAQWRTILKALLSKAYYPNDTHWKAVWDGLRSAPDHVALEIVKESAALFRVRAANGSWRTSADVLRPGLILPNHSDLANVLLDTEYHSNDAPLLSCLQIGTEPRDEMLARRSIQDDESYKRYASGVRTHYLSQLAREGKAPRQSYLDFLDGSTVLAGVTMLDAIPLASRGKLTALLLSRLKPESLRPAAFGHTTQGSVYDPIEVPSLTCWLLATEGAVEISSVCVKLCDLMTARAMEWVQDLPGCKALMHKLDILSSGFFGAWQMPAGNLESFWCAALHACLDPNIQTELRRSCYDAAAADGCIPKRVRVHELVMPLDQCFVTSSSELAVLTEKTGRPVIALSPETVDFWSKHGAKNVAGLTRIEHDGVGADPVSLLDLAPEITPVLVEERRDDALVYICRKLRIQIGDTETPLSAVLEDGYYLVDLEQLDAHSWQDRLTILVQEAISAGWIIGDAVPIAKNIAQRNYISRRAAVGIKATLEERLVAAVGGVSAAILPTFDEAVRRAIELKPALDALEIARLALAVHGPTVLSALQERLEDEGLQPPRRWGTREAFEFAAALGFPPEFGGSLRALRSTELWVSGPMPLGALHGYQTRLIEQLSELLAQHETSPARAVLSLPTGSGKTRIAVETALSCALGKRTRVLWIAQTDELCEQAVQSFRQVWANRGQPWTNLRLVRLWGGNPNPVTSDQEVPTVVVASIQTLTVRILGSLPDWIRDFNLVVIDEAHHAIAPSYTRLLAWLTGKELDSRRTLTPPLLGLSATPFRGRNEEESHRLARRFDGRLYPAPDEQSVLYEDLQAAGILSEILIEPLNYAEPFVLTDAEKKQIETFDEFPEAAAQRMGEDERRNDEIVRAVANYATNGQILLFANSVWHASHLAALLQLKGVQAAVVHGGTDSSARQYFIREFQKGAVKVLCNYGVLTSGFDAPKTDVIVITRPVFSPVRYMQMVGRGLRGERNGGTATCRVVTVVDNIVEYSDRLAHYAYFTPYYQR